MRHNGVAPVHHARIIAALIEHAKVHAQHTGIIHVALHGALVRADDHEVLAVQPQIGHAANHGLDHLIGGHHIVQAHQGHGVLHARVVRVKRHNVLHAKGLQLLQGHGAIQAFAVIAAVLAAAVQKGHHHADAVRLAAGRLNQALQILKMVVRAHAVFVAENFVLAAVVAHIHNEEQVIAANGRFNQALAVARRKTRAFAVDDKCLILNVRFPCPAQQVLVDLLCQFLRAGAGDDAKVCHTFRRFEKLFRTFFLCHNGWNTLLT